MTRNAPGATGATWAKTAHQRSQILDFQACVFDLTPEHLTPCMESNQVSPATRLLDFLAWLQAHRRQVLTGAVIVLVVGFILGMIITRQAQREARASGELSEIPLPMNPKTPPPPPEKFLQVAKDYPGSQAAARALLQAGGLLYAQGKYVEAQQQFERVLREYPDSSWMAEASLGVAASLEGQGKTAEAVSKYEEIRRRYSNSAIIDEAKLNLARLYENQNKPADAFKLYEELAKITQSNPYSGIGNEAGVHMEELLQKHPELAPPKTNAPAMIPPSLTMTNLSNRLVTNRTTNLLMLTNMVRMTNFQAMTNRPATQVTIPLRPPADTNK